MSTTDFNNNDAATAAENENNILPDDITGQSSSIELATANDETSILLDRVSRIEHDLTSAKNEIQASIPLISQSFTQIKKLTKDNKIATLVTMSPGIDFNTPDAGKYARYYLYYKHALLKMEASDGRNYPIIFGCFERLDETGFDAIDEETVAEFTTVVLQSIKSAGGKQKLLNSMGAIYTPSIFSLFEHIRSYHCGTRDIPLNFQDAFGTIKYGVNYNNVGAVKMFLSYADCIALFHPVKNPLTEGQKVETFIKNMDGSFKNKLLSYLFKRQLIESDDPFHITSSINDLDQLLQFISQYESSVNFGTKTKHLSSFTIDQSIRISNAADVVHTVKTKAQSSPSADPKPAETEPAGSSIPPTPSSSSNQGKSTGRTPGKMRSFKIRLQSNTVDSNDIDARPN